MELLKPYLTRKYSDYPEAWQHQTSRTRRFVLNSFPHKIIYAVREDRIIILAIANSHREPDYWVNRIKT